MRRRKDSGQRVKVSVTVDPELLGCVDAYLAAHLELDRSKVFDQALALWQARQQELEMTAQFEVEELSEEDIAERAAWRAVRDAAARQRFGEA